MLARALGRYSVFEIVVQPAIRRNHDGPDLLLVRFHQPLAIRHAEARREIQDGSPENALLRVIDDLRRKLRNRSLDDDARLHHALRDADLHVRDRLVGPRGEAIHARQEVVVVLRRAERMDPLARPRHREVRSQIRELVDGQQFAREAVAFDLDLAAVLEGLVGDEVLAAEPLWLDRLQLLECVLLHRERIRHPREAHVVAELRVEAVVALGGRGERVQLEVAVVVPLGDLDELRRGLVRRLQFRGCGRGGRVIARRGLTATCREHQRRDQRAAETSQ